MGAQPAIVDIANISLGSSERQGSSHFFKFHTSPTFEVISWRPATSIVIKGILPITLSINFAVTKNGMGAASGGLGDSTGTTLPEGSEVSGGQIIYAGAAAAFNVYPVKISVAFGEIVYVSKNQASAPSMLIFFDLT
jgi:ABC-type siderophore export system fused ATPase/permease subunit